MTAMDTAEQQELINTMANLPGFAEQHLFRLGADSPQNR